MKNQKVALITGANRGIGFETARQLGQKDVAVIIAARQLSDAVEAAAILTAEGITATGIELDITNASDRQKAVSFIEETYGKLDILINNAGIAPKETIAGSKSVATPPEEFEELFNVNFFSVIYLTNDLLPLIKKSEAGRIVNLSSILASLTVHSLPDSPIATWRKLSYNASKTALNAFTVHFADELKGTAIKVNSASPGWVKTNIGGFDEAPMTVEEGAKTSVDLALIGEDGPNGRFIHLGEDVAW
ncbi:SDR family oxidoreductase [Mucilaginibacter polytrichastri]|uniref:Uncharacterized protein n=1 Tax=Mucilaginibacter polytrichastri TaxID=1302689 RepID=A0A1Q5ZY86_9SPHI|nr:SDR family oxidoreductase [Mucilaginibacter polytrichastri]OKS86702.1 hypothetical protein RG47T_2159 [Mucilaginibacter polytrichastri]SFS82384.1 Short-chain dehydrogenase [Mucilaginibacter polytrichastri]